MRIVITNKDKMPAVHLRDNELEVRQPCHLPEPIIEVDKSLLDARQNFTLGRVYVENEEGLTARFLLYLRVNAQGQVALEVVAKVNDGGDTKDVSKSVRASYQL